MRTADDHAYLDTALPGRAWALFLRAHALAGRRIEAALIRRHDLPLASYDVLETLDAAPGRRLRMAELAGRVALSRSGTSRVVDQLERQGLVRRQHCDDDLRGMYAVLNPAGRQAVVVAAATLASCVHTQFGTALGADGAQLLVQVLDPLVAALAAGGPIDAGR
jgi:DNA-binding MarR family transcriptional regulator